METATHKRPVLIVDKKGIMGTLLAQFLTEIPLVVVVPSKYQRIFNQQRVSVVGYNRKIPTIPDISYAAIVVVYHGEKEIEVLLQDFYDKAANDNGRLIILTTLSSTQNISMQMFYKLHPAINLVVVGDLFGNNEILSEISPIHTMLEELLRIKRVRLSSMGLTHRYPVYIEDVLLALRQIIFTGKRGEWFVLAEPHPITELSFVRFIQKIDPLVKVDFDQHQSASQQQNPSFLANAVYLLGTHYQWQERLKQTYLIDQQTPSIKQAIQHSQKIHARPRRSPVSKKAILKMFFLLVITLIFFPLLATMFFAGYGIYQLTRLEKEISTGNIQQAMRSGSASHTAFAIASKPAWFLEAELTMIGKTTWAALLVKNLSLAQEVSMVSTESLASLEKIRAVLTGKSIQPQSDITSSVRQLNGALLSFQKLHVEFQDPSNRMFDNLIKSNQYLNEKRIENMQKIMPLATTLLQSIPEILGVGEKRSYLVLFQNNMELRPTGGFIGSYGLMRFDNGRLVDFTIHDVYDADGQLKGHVEPPFPLRRYLPSVHWYLRDSNFDVDFSKAASNAAYFLQQETGMVVDGVIAIDVSFAKHVVSALRSVYVPDYQQTVTADNFYLVTQRHAEKDFFPGSTQKKDFLKALFAAIQQKLTTQKILPYDKLAQAAYEGITEKHILFSFSKPALASLYEVEGYSSSLLDTREKKEGQILDFLGINEANLGINKANYFIERKVKQEVMLNNQGEISSNVTAYYTNRSTIWPGGDYKAYIRFIVPLGARLTSVTIDGQIQKITPAITDFSIYEKKGFVPPTQLEVDQYDERGKTIYGLLVVVAAGKSKTVKIAYILPQKTDLKSPVFLYDHVLFKQPGTDQDPFLFTFSHPASLTAFRIPRGFTKQPNKVSYLNRLTQDTYFTLEFTQR